jgi:hypothetical protein
MNKVIVVVIVLLIAVGVLGYTQGWFGSKGFDKEKFKKDRDKAQKVLVDKTKAAEKKIKDLTAKHTEAKDDDKAKLQKEIDELTKTVDEMKKRHDELDEKDEAKLEALQKKVQEILDEHEKAKKD